MFGKKEVLVHPSVDPLRTCNLLDFENELFCQTYLAHHRAEVFLDSHWTLYWPFGFMMAMPASRPQKWAEHWGCIFIFLWRYQGVDASEADDRAHEIVSKAMKRGR